jgi:hypothetical protein
MLIEFVEAADPLLSCAKEHLDVIVVNTGASRCTRRLRDRYTRRTNRNGPQMEALVTESIKRLRDRYTRRTNRNGPQMEAVVTESIKKLPDKDSNLGQSG